MRKVWANKSKKEKSERMSNAVNARWSKKTPAQRKKYALMMVAAKRKKAELIK